MKNTLLRICTEIADTINTDNNSSTTLFQNACKSFLDEFNKSKATFEKQKETDKNKKRERDEAMVEVEESLRLSQQSASAQLNEVRKRNGWGSARYNRIRDETPSLFGDTNDGPRRFYIGRNLVTPVPVRGNRAQQQPQQQINTEALQIPTLDGQDEEINSDSNGGVSISIDRNDDEANIFDSNNDGNGEELGNTVEINDDDEGTDGYMPRPNGVSNEFVRTIDDNPAISIANRNAENALHQVMRNMGQSEHSTLRAHVPGNRVNRERGAAVFGHVHARNRDLMGYMDDSVERQYAQMNVLSNEIRQFENSTLKRGQELEMLGRLSQMGDNIFSAELNGQLSRIINDRAKNLFDSLDMNNDSNRNN